MSEWIDNLRADKLKTQQEKELIIVQYADSPSVALNEFLEFCDESLKGVRAFGYASKFDKIFYDISDKDMVSVCQAMYKLCVAYSEFRLNLKAKIDGLAADYIYPSLDELKLSFSKKLSKYAKNQKDEILNDIIEPMIYELDKRIWQTLSLKEIISYSTAPNNALQGYLHSFSPLMAGFYFVNEKTRQRFDDVFSGVSNEILYGACEILGNFGVDYIEHCKNQALRLKGKKRIFAKLNFLKKRQIQDKLYFDKVDELEKSLQENARFKYASLKEIKVHYKNLLLEFAKKHNMQVVVFKQNIFATAIVDWYLEPKKS